MNFVDEELPNAPKGTEDAESSRSLEQVGAPETTASPLETGGVATADPKIRELEKKLDEFRKLRVEDQTALMQEIEERVALRKEQASYKDLVEKNAAKAAELAPGQLPADQTRAESAAQTGPLTVERLLALEPQQAVVALGEMAAGGSSGLDKAVTLLKQAYAVKREKVPYLIEELQKLLTGPSKAAQTSD